VDIWVLSQKAHGIDSAAAIERIVHQLEPSKDALASIRSTYPDAAFDLVLVAYINADEPALPDVTLSADLLGRIASLGLRFIVNFYLLTQDWSSSELQ
jgi:hypothetical protein